MPTPRENNMWSSIRTQLSEIQKHLLDGQNREAVLSSRELLKTLVRMQMNEACLVSTDLRGDVEQLFENRVIGTETREHYQLVNRIAEQASGGASIDAALANEAFSAIRGELSDYVEKSQRGGARAEAPSREAGNAAYLAGVRAMSGNGDSAGELNIPVRRRAEEGEERERVRVRLPRNNRAATGTRSTARRDSGRRVRSTEGRPLRNRTGRMSRRSSRYAEENVRELDIYTILKIVIPILCLILLVILFRVLRNGGKAEIQTTAPTVVESSIPETVPETTVPETTVPETTEAPKKWTTTEGVRVRTKPSTTDSEVLTVLEPGTEIQYKGDYDADWIKVDYNGQEAYIAKAYVKSEEISQ